MFKINLNLIYTMIFLTLFLKSIAKILFFFFFFFVFFYCMLRRRFAGGRTGQASEKSGRGIPIFCAAGVNTKCCAVYCTSNVKSKIFYDG